MTHVEEVANEILTVLQDRGFTVVTIPPHDERFILGVPVDNDGNGATILVMDTNRALDLFEGA